VHRLTQKQVAERAKITLQQYQKFESGARNIMTSSFRIACRVIEALELDITRFFHGEYVIGEEVYFVGKKLYYKKTGRPINEDVTEENDSMDRHDATE
jgi:transcriptional regulator with XRE-family HTH domain